MSKTMNLLNKLLNRYAGLPAMQMQRPATPAPQPQQPTLRLQPQNDVIQQSTNQALLSKMNRFIHENYDPEDPMAAEEISMMAPVAWKTQHRNLWNQALRSFQNTALPSPTMLPQQSQFPDMTDHELASIVLSHGRMFAFEELPPNIANNEHNRERYYEIASRAFQHDSASAAAAPEQQAQFSNPLAQEFYQNYLDAGAPNSEQFHSMLQRSEANFYGNQTGAEIDRLDQALTRIPEGFGGGRGRGKRNYDPVIGFFVSMGKRHLRPYKHEIAGMSAPQMAQYLMQNHQSELDALFNELMVSQDSDVFEYVSDLLKMKTDSAGAGAAALIDKENGGVIDVGENRGVSNMVRGPGEGEGSTSEEKGLLWNAFRSIPKAVDQTGMQLKEMLDAKAAQHPQGSPERQRLSNLANYTAAYLGAMDRSFSDVHKALTSGNAIDPKFMKELEGKGVRVIPIKTPSGNRIEITLDGVADPNDAIETMNFADLVPPRQMVGHLISYLDQLYAKDGNPNPQAMTDQILSPGQKWGPLDRNRLATDPAYATEVKKKIWTSTQFIPAYIGDDVMSGLQSGKFSPQTVRAMFKMLRPHSDSSKWGRMLSRHNRDGDKARREWLTDKMNAGHIAPADIGKMDASQLYDYFVQNARPFFQQLPSDKRKPGADFLGRFHDYGKQPSGWTGWPQTATASHIYENAIMRIADLVDLRNSMMKFASVDHIDAMIKAIQNDARDRVRNLWKK